MSLEVREVETPHGVGRLHCFTARKPQATVLLSHGAGGGVDAGDLQTLAQDLPPEGFSVLLFEQPWRVAGRKVATAPKTLDVALLAAAAELRLRHPLVVGGRSAGARSACRVSAAIGAVGVLAISFPLHGTSRTAISRLPELTAVQVPVLVVQGERDNFGRPEEFPSEIELVVVPAASHGLAVPKRGELSQEQAFRIVSESALQWLVREVVGAPGV